MIKNSRKREKILHDKQKNSQTSTIAQQLAKLEKTQLNFPALSNELPFQQNTSGDSYAKTAKSVQQQKAKKEGQLDETSPMLLTILEKYCLLLSKKKLTKMFWVGLQN